MSKLGQALTELLRARRHLGDGQGRIARRNARDDLKKHLKLVTKALDVEYPAIRKEPRVRLLRTAAAKRRRKNKLARERMRMRPEEAVTLTAAGIKVQTVQVLTADGRDSNAPVTRYEGPRWAVQALRAKVAAEEIKRAIRSRTIRSRIEALVRLSNP